MRRYKVAEAKARFSKLVRRALQGQEVLIARANNPPQRLTPVEKVEKERCPGSAKGQILAVSPDFDDVPDDFK